MFFSSGVCRSHNGRETCDRGREGEPNPATGTGVTALHRKLSQWQRGEGGVRELGVETIGQKLAVQQCIITACSQFAVQLYRPVVNFAA